MTEDKCLYCVWAKWVGTGVFCPWPKGMCLKNDEKKGKKKNDRKRISGACNEDRK